MNRIEKAQRLLEQSEKDLARMQKITDELKIIEQNRIKLDQYYSDYYVEDYEKFESQRTSPRALDQDSIWNTLCAQYQEKIALLKNITNSL